jgi:hypothetical protein
MTAARAGAARAANDYYPTPAWCVDRLLDLIGDRLPHADHLWIEPAAGDGAIMRAVDDWYELRAQSAPAWLAYDIDPRAAGISRVDYLHDFHNDPESWDRTQADVAITNPPYSLALDFVQAMREDARIVCALLRLGFLASEERARFFRGTLPSVYVLPNRPSFTGDGKTDAHDYAWCVWGLDPEPRIDWLAPTPRHVRRPVQVRP